MSHRVGILHCLLYYPFFPFWRRFFDELGFETVVSPPMTSRSFDKGQRNFVGDTCLPIESSFYHVEAIKDDVDTIFIPRINNVHKDTYVCPACAGLAYIVRAMVSGVKDILAINLTPFVQPDRADLRQLKRFGLSAGRARAAYLAARDEYDSFVRTARRNPDLESAMTGSPASPPAEDPTAEDHDVVRICLLGMPYVLGDPFVSQGIPRMLAEKGCQLTTPMMVVPELANREVTIEGYSLYWPFAGMCVATLARMLNDGAADGVVYCSSFACGVDSLITPIVRSACKRCYKVPYLLLVLDEHAEASHLHVRIEAFLDCVESHKRLRKGKP